MDEFEELLEDQFRLDLISDAEVDNQDEWDECIAMYDRAINDSIHQCINKMNKRRY